MATIADVVIKISSKGLDKLNRNLDAAERKTGSLSKKARLMKSFTKGGIIGLAILAVAALGAAMVIAGREATTYADSIGKTAIKLGITTDELQRMRVVAEAAGVSVTDFDTSFQRFSRRVGEVKRGTGELNKVFKDNGIELRDAAGNVKTNTQLYNEFAGVIRNTKDHTVAMSLAMKGFDEAGAKMINVLRTSEAEMKRLNAKMKEYGIIMDADVIKKAATAATEMALLNQGSKVMATEMALNLAPVTLAWDKFLLIMSRGSFIFSKLIGLAETPLDEQMRNAIDAFAELQKQGASTFQSESEFQEELAEKRARATELVKQYNTEVKNTTKVNADAFIEKQALLNAEQDALDVLTRANEKKKEALAIEKEITAATTKRNAEIDKFENIESKLMDEAAMIRIDAITDEKARITDLEDFKQQKAFDEISQLKLTNDAKLLLQEQYLDVREQREEATIKRVDEKNKSALQRQAGYYNETTTVMSDMAVGWTNNAASALTQMVMTGKADFGALAKSIIADILQMIIKQQLFNAMAGFFPGAAAAGSSANTVATGPSVANADGGVINRFTSFSSNGQKNIAGEAGSEAILPLRRDRNGKLGVASNGGASTATNVNVQIINNSQANVTQQTSTDAFGEKTIQIMVNDALNGLVQSGRMDKVLKPYGVTRAGTR